MWFRVYRTISVSDWIYADDMADAEEIAAGLNNFGGEVVEVMVEPDEEE